MSWDSEIIREQMLLGNIAVEHAYIYDDHKPMGNWALGIVGSIVTCCLVGLADQMLDLCPQAVSWIDRSIARNEEFAGDTQSHHQRLTSAKALALWFESGAAATDVWSDAFCRIRDLTHAHRHFLKGAWLGERMDDLMACAFQGRHCAQGVAMYEDLIGAKTFKLSAVRNPRQFAYALCLHALALEARFEAADLLAAGRRVLSGQLAENWLHNGQMIRAATWLKIVYWHSAPSLTPEQTMLKAYDDMPTVPRPNFLSNPNGGTP